MILPYTFDFYFDQEIGSKSQALSLPCLRIHLFINDAFQSEKPVWRPVQGNGALEMKPILTCTISVGKPRSIAVRWIQLNHAATLLPLAFARLDSSRNETFFRGDSLILHPLPASYVCLIIIVWNNWTWQLEIPCQWRFIAGKINYAWSINADYMFPLNLRRHRLFHTDTYVSFLKWGGFLGYVAPNDPKLDHFFGLKPMVLDPILAHPHLWYSLWHESRQRIQSW